MKRIDCQRYFIFLITDTVVTCTDIFQDPHDLYANALVWITLVWITRVRLLPHVQWITRVRLVLRLPLLQMLQEKGAHIMAVKFCCL